MRTDRPLTLTVTEAGNVLGVSRSPLTSSSDPASSSPSSCDAVPVAAVAERLGIAVPEVWLALGRQGEDAPVEVDLRNRPVPDVLIEDVPDDVHADLVRHAHRRGQSLQQFLQTELERLASRPTADDVLDMVESHRHGGRVGFATAVEDLREARP